MAQKRHGPVRELMMGPISEASDLPGADETANPCWCKPELGRMIRPGSPRVRRGAECRNEQNGAYSSHSTSFFVMLFLILVSKNYPKFFKFL